MIGHKQTQSCNPVVEEDHRIAVARDGTFEILERHETYRNATKCYGRRPDRYESAPTSATSAIGAWFANVAQLEAASIEAFQILRDELGAHGAPQALVDAAEVSARDEVRHAAMMTRMARRFGAEVSRPIVERRPTRTLFEIARENAVEGCVHETYGAVLASMQAELAGDRHIARMMRRIAAEETRHAELAWAVAAWAHDKLDDSQRAEVDRAMRLAVDHLAHDVNRDVDAALRTVAGVPPPELANAALNELRARLWS